LNNIPYEEGYLLGRLVLDLIIARKLKEFKGKFYEIENRLKGI